MSELDDIILQDENEDEKSSFSLILVIIDWFDENGWIGQRNGNQKWPTNINMMNEIGNIIWCNENQWIEW